MIMVYDYDYGLWYYPKIINKKKKVIKSLKLTDVYCIYSRYLDAKNNKKIQQIKEVSI